MGRAPVTTASASRCAATSHAPASPTTISGREGASFSSSRSSATRLPSRMATSDGRNSLTCARVFACVEYCLQQAASASLPHDELGPG